MQEQGIPFYRFNPQLDEVIPSGETDLAKLINMLIKVSNNSWTLITPQCYCIADKGVYDERTRIGHVDVEGTCTTAPFSGRDKQEEDKSNQTVHFKLIIIMAIFQLHLVQLCK